MEKSVEAEEGRSRVTREEGRKIAFWMLVEPEGRCPDLLSTVQGTYVSRPYLDDIDGVC
jgi:hypothetical protein